MLEGVIYDLDGTLVDSRDDLADSVNAMLARLGLPARNPPVIHGFIGQVYDGIAELLRRTSPCPRRADEQAGRLCA